MAAATAAVTAAQTGMKRRQAAAMTTAMPTAVATGFDYSDDSECGLISPITVVQGPSTLSFALSAGDA